VFRGSTPIEVLLRHVQEEPTPLRVRTSLDIPGALETAILTCLAKDPKARPQSAEELDRTLAAIPFAQSWTRARAREAWRERFA
jgi:hypothetical protein